MLEIRRILETLSTALKEPGTIADAISTLERAIRRELDAQHVQIRLGDDPASPIVPASGSRRVAVPLRLDGADVGTLIVDAPAREEATELLADVLAAPIALTLAWRQRTEDRVHLYEVAHTDALTGIANRLAFDERLAAAWERCRTSGLPLSLSLIDIDFFKAFNDLYGHVAGDRCLLRISTLMARRRRDDDGFVARYGGEEFAVVLEGCPATAAISAAERFLSLLAQERIEHGGSTLGRVSASVGIASIVPVAGDTIDDLLDETDRALYRAKFLGRNRICAGDYSSASTTVARYSGSIAAVPRLVEPTVGRDADAARLRAALRQERLVTLVGPPGIGKSRLAKLVAGTAGAFEESAVFVDFRPLADSTDPVVALGAALEITVDSGSMLDVLCDAVSRRHMLLIFDNVDRVKQRICALCDVLLRRAPSASILVTSTSELGLFEERALVVSPLEDADAFELFLARSGIDRAAEAHRLDSLRTLVRTFGGVPGAIEAAALRIAHDEDRT